MVEKTTAFIYSFLCLCASFLVIKGVPDQYYAALFIILTLDAIFTFLINRQLKNKPIQTTIPKILNTAFFLIFLTISFNTICLLENRITAYGLTVVFIIIAAYLTYIFKTGVHYFATTTVSKELLGVGKYLARLFKAANNMKDV